jgi:glycosyltransferase involved in cell wall biosynthesis
MNIAITSLYLPSGSKIGVGYQVHYLANELVARGHRVTVFSQTGSSPDSRYQVQVVPSGRRLRTFGFAWGVRQFDLSGFDVLNGHGDDWFLWGRRRPRHIHTFHGSCMAEALHAKTFTGKVRMAALAACEYNVCMMADELVAVSANTRRYVPWVKHVIPCGVNVDRFHPGNKKAPDPTILFVGTLHGRKRGQMLIDQFTKVIRPRVPNARLWCVCEEPVHAEGVESLGRVELDRLVELYQQAWVFCLPSTYEGFGVPYVEAMACGLPVVASPNVGAIEVTQEGRAGIVARDEELGQTLVRLLEDSAMRLDYTERGLERSAHFSWSNVCAMYEAIYAGSASAACPGEPAAR